MLIKTKRVCFFLILNVQNSKCTFQDNNWSYKVVD